jgi:hypothetical protein
MIRGDLCRDAYDGLWIANIELNRDHAGIRIGHGFESRHAPARDDYLVPALVKRLGKTAADAGTAAGDEYCVAVHFHGALLGSLLVDFVFN